MTFHGLYLLFVILSGSWSFGTDGSFSSICARLGGAGTLLETLEREMRASRERAKSAMVSRRVVILGIGRPKTMYCFGIVKFFGRTKKE